MLTFTQITTLHVLTVALAIFLFTTRFLAITALSGQISSFFYRFFV